MKLFKLFLFVSFFNSIFSAEINSKSKSFKMKIIDEGQFVLQSDSFKPFDKFNKKDPITKILDNKVKTEANKTFKIPLFLCEKVIKNWSFFADNYKILVLFTKSELNYTSIKIYRFRIYQIN